MGSGSPRPLHTFLVSARFGTMNAAARSSPPLAMSKLPLTMRLWSHLPRLPAKSRKAAAGAKSVVFSGSNDPAANR